MIREVARCPYCGDLSAGMDDAGPDLVLAPDRADGRPCAHLAFLSVGVEALDPGGRRDASRTRMWLWVRGDGTREIPPGVVDDLVEYVGLLACQIPMVGVDPPATAYRIGGGTAGDRDAAAPGTGEIRLPGPGRLAAIFDGHALYAEDPAALVAEVRRLAEGD